MAIIFMVLRKMIKNKWLVLCLLLGLIISIALVSSMPMYSGGVLQKLLVKDLEQYQQESNNYPGGYQLSLYFQEDIKYEDRGAVYDKLDKYIKQDVPQILGKPYLTFVQSVALDPYRMTPEDPTKVAPDPNRYGKIQALIDFENHVKLIDGRMPAKEKVDGVYEALVTESALNKLNMVLGNVFIMTNPNDESVQPIKVKPVGVFVPKDERDLYWFRSLSTYDESFIINYDLFKKDFIEQKQALVKSSSWYYALDYQQIKVQDISGLTKHHAAILRYVNEVYNASNGIAANVPMMLVMQKYLVEQKQLSLLMLVLNVPVLLMLIFYLFMVSFLIIDADKNEIAVLRSRGAGRGHIMLQYLIEGVILAGLAFILGPPLGLLFTKFLGASNGFLEFVNRKALPAELSIQAYQYAFVAAVFSVVTMLAPAYFASNVSIVSHKQQLARYVGSSWWQRSFIDIILVGIAVYGLYTFKQYKQILVVTSVNATDLQINPVLFFASTLFALGVGLLFLRIYPWVLEGIYRLGNRWWSPPLYETLTQVSRSSRQYQFLMIFLIMTIATGLFSANAARTINLNTEERIRYRIGADVTMMPAWESNAPSTSAGVSMMGQTGAQQSTSQSTGTTEKVQYSEPPFLSYEQLPGVEHAAKVFTRDRVDVAIGGQRASNVQLMAIEPYDFGMTVWFRSDLLKPYHINDYLNLLAQEPSAVLVSRSFSKTYDVKPGDYIYIGWNGVDAASFTVYGVIDYWPSWNPNRDPNAVSVGDEDTKTDPMLIVANLPYVQNHLALEPYEIWLKLKPGATSAELYKGIEDKNLQISELQDANQEVIKARTDPMYLGMNGAMTLGFIISLVITFLGFLLYWILSMRNRTFEFGVLRAIGISLSQLLGMMVWEQLLTSGMAVIAGILVGGLTSKLFVPLFQVAYNSAAQVPPFKVISAAGDRLRLYIMVGIMLAVGFAVLGNILSRIKINQAIKMGEE